MKHVDRYYLDYELCESNHEVHTPNNWNGLDLFIDHIIQTLMVLGVVSNAYCKILSHSKPVQNKLPFQALDFIYLVLTYGNTNQMKSVE